VGEDVGLRDKMRRLERAAEGEVIVIPQAGGTVKRFPTSALKDAFLVNVDRICGKDVEPHPLSVAIQNAAHREPWHDSFFDMVEVGENVADLCEP
jgi:hypothetical protein